MSPVRARVARIKTALAEIQAQRFNLSDDTVREVVRALNDKIATLEAEATPLPLASDTDQIRLVSVMFVDVENSTRLAANLGEEWKSLLDEIHSRIARIVEEWDGEVGQYLGDGMLSFFGAHRSRGDDAARAVGCALAIQAMAQAFAHDITRRYGEDLALRVGISTGRVVVGVIGSAAKREVAAVGSTTNLAARLQHLCPARAVLVDADTYFQIRDYYVVQTQTPVKLKGFDAPLQFYLVTTPKRQQTLAHVQIAGITLPFVGRKRELDYLRRLWGDALNEQSLHAVVIYGDIGVGKSRLMQEALARLRETEPEPYIITLTVEDVRQGGTYALLRQLLSEQCHSVDEEDMLTFARIYDCVRRTWPGDDAQTAATVLSRMIGLVSDEEAPATLDPLETAARWLLSLAGVQPLVLLVDSLTLADQTSLDLLEYIALFGVHTPGLVITAARSDFRTRRPGFMASASRLTEFTLGGLRNSDTRALVQTVTARVEDVPASLIDNVCRLAQGNVLFVEEYLRMLFDSRVFTPNDSGGWRVNAFLYQTAAASVPNGLLGVIQARLDDLRPVARRVVPIAAIFGQTFWEGAISHLAGFATQATLDDLVERDILTVKSRRGPNWQPTYHFRHTLYQDVAYGMLTRPDREAYHRRAAEWLQNWTDAHPDLLALRADHLVRGGRRAEALAVFLSAVKHHVQAGELGEALKLIESGLASARDIPRERALPVVSQLWLWQGVVYLASEQYAQASAAAQSALMLMQELPPDLLMSERAQAAATLDIAVSNLDVQDRSRQPSSNL